jgi:hypothetical protein
MLGIIGHQARLQEDIAASHQSLANALSDKWRATLAA